MNNQQLQFSRSNDTYLAYLINPNTYGKYSLCQDGTWYNSKYPIPTFKDGQEAPIPDPIMYEGKTYDATIAFTTETARSGKEYHVPKAVILHGAAHKTDANPITTNPLMESNN